MFERIKRFGHNAAGVLEWIVDPPDVVATSGLVEQSAFALRWDNGSEAAADYITDSVSPANIWAGAGADSTEISFGTTSQEKVAVRIVGLETLDTLDATLKRAKTGSPTDNFRVSIYTDNAGEPGTLLDYGQIGGSGIGTTLAFGSDIPFTNNVTLHKGGTYFLVFERTGSLSDTDYYKVGGATSVSGQDSYILDDGTWSGTTSDPWAQIYGTVGSVPLSPEVGYRVRFLLTETGGKKASDSVGVLQFRKNGGTWTNVTVSTTDAVHTYSAAKENNGTATTQQLGSGTFTAGEFSTDGSTSIAIPAGEETEIEYDFWINSDYVSDGDVIELRVVYSDYTVLDSYATGSTPSITVKGYRLEQDGFRYREDDGTWLAALNTDPSSLDLDTTYRMRFLAALTQGYRNSGPRFELWFRRNSGSWTKAASGQAVKTVVSTYLTDGADLTQLLGSGTFVADNDGALSSTTNDGGKSPNDGTTTSESSPGCEVEVEIAFQVDSTYASASDTIELRLEENSIPDAGYSQSITNTDFYAYNQVPTITVASSGTTYPKTMTVSGGGTASFARVPIWARAISASGVGTALFSRLSTRYIAQYAIGVGTATQSRMKTFARSIAPSGVGSAVVSRISTRYLSIVVSGTGTAVFAFGRLFTRTISATVTGTVGVARTIGLSFTPTGGGTAVFAKGLTLKKTIAPTAVGSAVVNRGLFLPMDVTGVGTATVVNALFFQLVQNVTAAGSASLSRAATYYRALVAAASGSVSVTRVSTRYIGMTVTAVGAAASARNATFYRPISVTAAGTVSTSQSYQTFESMTLSGVGTVLLQYVKTDTVAKVINAVGTATVAVAKKVTKFLSVSGTGTATVTPARIYTRAINVTATAVASLVKQFIAWVPGVAHLRRHFMAWWRRR